MEPILIFGGDMRNFHLHELCRSHSIRTRLMGFDRIDPDYGVIEGPSPDHRLTIGPIPLTVDGSSVYMPFSDTRMPLTEFRDTFLKQGRFITGLGGFPFQAPGSELIDLTKNEAFLLKNAIPTVEGILELLIRESDRTIHGSRSLVLGFGRIGSRLSGALRNLGSQVTVATNSATEEARAVSEGHGHMHLSALPNGRLEFDYLVNTIPHVYVTRDVIDRIGVDTLMVDVASNPGGIDVKYAEQTKHKTLVARGIPGKSSPRTSAAYIFETIGDQIRNLG